jgi:hypothetical protein
VIAEPPLFRGADHEIVAALSLGIAVTAVATPGTVFGTTPKELIEIPWSPAALVAVTLKV